MQKLYVVQRSNSKHLCVIVSICVSKRLINYKGVVSSITIITMRTKDVRGKIAHTMDHLVEQGKLAGAGAYGPQEMAHS